MRMFTGYEPGRALPRLAGWMACGALALAALTFAPPARGADFGYGYPAPHAYPAYPRHGEYYEYRVPAPPPHYGGVPLEYRVVVYPPRPRYGEIYAPPAAYPSGVRYDDRYYAPRPVYRAAGLPYEPYGRALDPAVPLPPAPVGPRW